MAWDEEKVRKALYSGIDSFAGKANWTDWKRNDPAFKEKQIKQYMPLPGETKKEWYQRVGQHMKPALLKSLEETGFGDAIVEAQPKFGDNQIASDTSAGDAVRAEQTNLYRLLEERSRGKGPSLVSDQLTAASDSNLAAALQGGAGRGGRGITTQVARTGQGIAGQSGAQRLEEMGAARGRMGDMNVGMRAQDLSQARGRLDSDLRMSLAELDMAAKEYAAGRGQLAADKASMYAASGQIAQGAGTTVASAVDSLKPKNKEPQYGQPAGYQPGWTNYGTSQPEDWSNPYGGYSEGGLVPGVAPVPGDDPANDVVIAAVSPGEIVVPRTAAENQSKAKAYITQLFKEEGRRGHRGYGQVMAERRQIDAELERLKKLKEGLGG